MRLVMIVENDEKIRPAYEVEGRETVEHFVQRVAWSEAEQGRVIPVHELKLRVGVIL